MPPGAHLRRDAGEDDKVCEGEFQDASEAHPPRRPVYGGGDGDVVAALSVSGPSFRMDAEDFPRLARRVLAGADELSRRLGFFG